MILLYYFRNITLTPEMHDTITSILSKMEPEDEVKFSNMAALDNHMIIFCLKEYEDLVHNQRKFNKNTLIIPLYFNDNYVDLRFSVKEYYSGLGVTDESIMHDLTLDLLKPHLVKSLYYQGSFGKTTVKWIDYRYFDEVGKSFHPAITPDKVNLIRSGNLLHIAAHTTNWIELSTSILKEFNKLWRDKVTFEGSIYDYLSKDEDKFANFVMQ